MLRTVQFACTLPKVEADVLNAESGRVYVDMVVRHYRLYRKQGVCLAPRSGERLEDALGGPTTLHAHSRDAAQQGFYKACKTARTCRQAGLDVKYPHRRKRFRTTVWKRAGISSKDDMVRLARARGLAPVSVLLPSNFLPLPTVALLEARLVWDRAARHYTWHLVAEDGTQPAPPLPTEHTAAVDLGKIHPAAVTDGQETLIITCRALRANQQYTAKRLSEIRARQSRQKKGSRAWGRLQRRKSRFLAKQKRRACDMEHKVSRAVVSRYLAGWDGLHAVSQTQGARLPLPSLRFRLGIGTAWGVPTCSSGHYTGEPGHVLPPKEKYRHPVQLSKRSRLDTADLACGQQPGKGHPKKLRGFSPSGVSQNGSPGRQESSLMSGAAPQPILPG